MPIVPVLPLLLLSIAQPLLGSETGAAAWPRYVHCDLGAYLGRTRAWTQPEHPYTGLPRLPEGARWTLLRPDRVCNMLVAGLPYAGPDRYTTASRGICELRVTWDAEVQWPEPPYFVFCSTDPAAYRGNKIAYVFTQEEGIAAAATETAAAARSDSDVGAPTLVSWSGDGTVYAVDHLNDGGWVSCAHVVHAPDLLDVGDAVIRDNIQLFDNATGEPLEFELVAAYRLDDVDAGVTCHHADYQIELELEAEGPLDAAQQTSATLRVRRRVIDTDAPMIEGVPSQPDVLPTSVQCASDARRWTDRVIPTHYLPYARAYDTCRGAVALDFRYTVSQSVYADIAQGEDEAAFIRERYRRCENRATYTLQWTAEDGCGNAAAITQPIHVLDTRPPELLGAEHLRFCLVQDQVRALATQGIAGGPPSRQWCLSRREEQAIAARAAAAFSDSCEAQGIDPADVTLDWSGLDVEHCVPSTHIGTGYDKISGCAIVAAARPRPAQLPCFDLETLARPWARVRVPVAAADSCGNTNARHALDILVVDRLSSCADYGAMPILQ